MKLPLKRQKGRVYIEPSLAERIIPSDIRPGLSLASVTGELDVKDNVYVYKNVDDRGLPLVGKSSGAQVKDDTLKEKKDEYGVLDPQELLQKMNQEGFHGAKLQHGPTSTCIHLVMNFELRDRGYWRIMWYI